MVPPPLLRRLRLTLLALVLVLAGLGWRLAVAPAFADGAEAWRAGREIPFADVAPYGANFFLDREVEPWKQEKTVEMAAAAGLRWAKQHFPWSDIEPRPGQFNFEKYDQLVDLYRDHGIQVIARLDWPPAWVTPADWVPPEKRGQVNAPPRDPEDFARFVGQTVRHFRGRLRFYQIWNEPNLVAEWGDNPDHPVDPAEYRALLAAAARAARAADPDAVLLSAPLAINLETPDLRGNMNDLDYLDGLYRAGAAPDFDLLSSNAFGMDRPPEDAPDPGQLNFRRAELQRAVMERHGDAGKAVWFNEYGWNAAPPGLFSPWRQVSEDQQADYTTAGLRWAAQHWPWAGAFAIWYFRQWGQMTPAMADFYFGMVDVQFMPRRLYERVREAARALEVAGPGDWAERSAPVVLADLDQWRWHRAAGAVDGNALTSLAPEATLRFQLRGGALAARLAGGPRAGAFEVVVDGQPARRLRGPTEAPAGSWHWVTLASDLGPGVHRVTLTTKGAGELGLDGFRVAAPTGLARLDPWLLGLGFLALALGGLALADARAVARRIRV